MSHARTRHYKSNLEKKRRRMKVLRSMVQPHLSNYQPMGMGKRGLFYAELRAVQTAGTLTPADRLSSRKSATKSAPGGIARD